MKAIMASIYDSKVKIWSQPHLFVNKGAALRAWEEAANDPSSPFSKHPTDYTMFIIGVWDDQEGRAEMLMAQESLGTAVQFKRHDQQPPAPLNIAEAKAELGV